MKYIDFGPSQLELRIIEALDTTTDSWISKLEGIRISKKEVKGEYDHPEIVMTLEDGDGDKHEVTLRVIHTPEEDLIAQGFADKDNN